MVEADKKKNFAIIEASFASATQVSVFWRYLELQVSDWADSFCFGTITSGSMIHMKTISSNLSCIKEAKDGNWRVQNWWRMKDILTKDVWWWILSEGDSLKDYCLWSFIINIKFHCNFKKWLSLENFRERCKNFKDRCS